MDSGMSIFSEENLRCCICLDLFVNPVSTPCGHTFCLICLKCCWDCSDPCRCPLCKETFETRPNLSINRNMLVMAETLRKMIKRPHIVPCDICTGKKQQAHKSCLVCLASYCLTHLEPHDEDDTLRNHKLVKPLSLCEINLKPEAEVQQMILERKQKMEEIKWSVELSEANTDREIELSEEVYRSLLQLVERNQEDLTDLLEEKQRATEKRAQILITQLEQEITELQKNSTQREMLSQSEDYVDMLQTLSSLCAPIHTRDWSEVTVHTVSPVGALRESLEKGVRIFQREIQSLCEKELTTIQQYAVDVTLDPDTANPWLYLSENSKEVRDGSPKQDLHMNPQRYDESLCVVGKKGFISGRHYWEVEVGRKTAWDVGISREYTPRQGVIRASPNNGYWVLCLRKGNEYKCCSTRRFALPKCDKPQKVGVYVDHEEGQISFYNVLAKSHIHTYHGSFGERMFPTFSPHLEGDGRNSDPLIISSVTHLK